MVQRLAALRANLMLPQHAAGPVQLHQQGWR
jgi:hypothetical protein